MDTVRDIASALDPRVWGLIGLALGTVLTLQAVETAVDGAWPHQRRPIRAGAGARVGQTGWAVVALLLLVGLLIGLASLAIVAWRELDIETTQWVGAALVGLAWALFLLGTTDRLAPGRYLRGLGATAPAALSILLVAGAVLLLVTLVDIRPTWDEVRDALPI